MANPHFYRQTLTWIGAKQGPAESYLTYSRDFEAEYDGKPSIQGSADPSYRGDASRLNPEDLLVTAVASCHLLTYLALCTRNKYIVISYSDTPEGTMQMQDGKMSITDIVLRPKVVLAPGADIEKARKLHEEAHDQCFITNSVRCDVSIVPEIVIEEH